MPGRYQDSADYFAVSDPATLCDGQLVDLLIVGCPNWLTQAPAWRLAVRVPHYDCDDCANAA